METLIGLFGPDGLSLWAVLLVLAMIALVLEIVSPAFIFLGLSLALALGAALSWAFGLGPVAIAAIVAVGWFVAAFGLRLAFPSSGEIRAKGDPNTYDRDTPWVVSSESRPQAGDSAEDTADGDEGDTTR
ncbi:hypothetical protein ACQ5SP_06045 [Rhodovulum sp. YNF3179]|uniref:hypothetical protein n=1 Tax=Rhodovulum sp. YNF3179 TaxID=3425127 RepID=UPI003D325B82